MGFDRPWLLFNLPAARRAPTSPGWLWERVREPPEAIRAAVEAQALRLQPPEGLPRCLARAAEDLIGSVPTLSRIAEQSIAAIHVLSAEPGFDVSHSEPRWRSTIFVSTPERLDGVGALRFAEGIIHEAMHLHLTNAEAIAPLVSDFDGQMRSPWRAERRSYQGVLHALFVFACLAAFFRDIRRQGDVMPADCQRHVDRRLKEIQGEMARLDLPRLTAGLTALGAESAAFCHAQASHVAGRHLEEVCLTFRAETEHAVVASERAGVRRRRDRTSRASGSLID